jgi:hypothetical protein
MKNGSHIDFFGDGEPTAGVCRNERTSLTERTIFVVTVQSRLERQIAAVRRDCVKGG